MSPADRNKAKRTAYSVLYGVGKEALGTNGVTSLIEPAEQLSLSERDSQTILDSFSRRLTSQIVSLMVRFPAIARHGEKVAEVCRRQGFVKSLFNRRRYFSSINSSDVSLI